MARVAANARRLAGDQRMLVGESDSYAGAIGRPDRDDRIVAEALAPSDGAEVAKAFVGDLRAFRKGRPSPAATRCSSKRRRRSPRERLVTSAPASSRAPSSRGSAKRLFWVSSVAAPDSPPGSLTLAEAKQAPRPSFEEPLGVGGEVELTGLVSEREGIEVGQRRLVEDHRVVGAEQDLAAAVGRAQ